VVEAVVVSWVAGRKRYADYDYYGRELTTTGQETCDGGHIGRRGKQPWQSMRPMHLTRRLSGRRLFRAEARMEHTAPRIQPRHVFAPCPIRYEASHRVLSCMLGRVAIRDLGHIRIALNAYSPRTVMTLESNKAYCTVATTQVHLLASTRRHPESPRTR
jgi:hypothetical protein